MVRGTVPHHCIEIVCELLYDCREVSVMSVLDAFVPENSGMGAIFVSVTGYGMTFSKASVEALGFPRLVRVYYDRKGKRFAVAPSLREEGARTFVRDPEGPRAGFVRWNDRRLLDQVISLGALELGENGLRVMGEYVPGENILVYDLTRTVPVVGKGTRHA